MNIDKEYQNYGKQMILKYRQIDVILIFKDRRS